MNDVGRAERGWARWTRRASLALALCVPAGGAAALAVHAYNAYSVPSRDDWRAAAAAIRAAWQPGDVVAFLPGWAQEGRGELAGLDVLVDEKWDDAHIGSRKRVHVIASFGETPPAWLRAESDAESSEAFGRLMVHRVRMREGARRFDFTGRVGEAEVSLVHARAPEEKCEKRGNRFDCTRGGRFGWRWVGEHRAVIGGAPRRCLWAHPTNDATLRIRFPSVPMGRTLKVAQGLVDQIAGGGAPVTLDVLVGDRRVGTLTRAPKRGFDESTFDTSALAGRGASVTFEIRTPSDGSRHFCFAAEALP